MIKELSMLKKSRLVKVSKSLAESFMQSYEHLGNVGLGVWHWGLDLNGKVVGVVSYGTTCFSTSRGWLASIAREARCTIIQLCRGGSSLDAPKGTGSRLISLANREMSKLKGPLLIVAYADPALGEIGTIYQACNAIYTGITEPKGQANYIIDGEKLSGWQVRKRYGTRARIQLSAIDPNHQVLPLGKRHRYIMLAGSRLTRRRLRKQLSSFVLSYPNREKTGVGQMKVSRYPPIALGGGRTRITN